MAGFLASADSLWAAPKHGIAMHGEPELSTDFTHLPYTNPQAPKGGTLTFGEVGSFDSLNPYILKGSVPWALRLHTAESLMARNWDEPFTLYGLIAESVEVPEDRSWVEFTLRPEARFSDGSPVTVDDVIYSMELLDEEGKPPYFNGLRNVSEIIRKGDRGVRFVFETPDREAPLILGLRPVLQKTDLEARVFKESSLTPLITTGPYVVGKVEAGRSLTLVRNPDYWGRDLPVMRGQANLDEIRIEFFRDGNAHWEAFKAGEVDIFRDGDPVRWESGYDFAAARDGRIARSEVGHGRPTGMRGFVFNTRKEMFTDIRVREALTLAFDFEWLQRTMLSGAYARIPSYFGASPLGHDGAATGEGRALLEPFADSLPPGALDATIRPPAGSGDGRNRRNMRLAADLLSEAGWAVVDGVLRNPDGVAFSFEILLSSSANEQVSSVFTDALKRLGITATVRLVDSAQYETRRTDYDYDMIINTWALSLSPGVEQRLYWHSDGVTEPGTRNYMGVANPAVDAAIAALTVATTQDVFEGAARALDRALSAGRYVIPFWYAPTSRIAHSATLTFPERTPLYGDWIGFLPDVWWRTE
ncbi:MAG: extracellular solute-binding protein [Pseudomonadota bacterium]